MKNKVTLVNRKPCKCPHCGGKVVPVIYGEPTPETYERSLQGEFVLGGCIIDDDNPDWECLECHRGFRKARS